MPYFAVPLPTQVNTIGRRALSKNDGKLKRKVYEDRLAELHFELVKMQ